MLSYYIINIIIILDDNGDDNSSQLGVKLSLGAEFLTIIVAIASSFTF